MCAIGMHVTLNPLLFFLTLEGIVMVYIYAKIKYQNIHVLNTVICVDSPRTVRLLSSMELSILAQVSN